MKQIIFGFSRPLKWKPYAEMIMAIDDSNFSHGYTRFRSDRWDIDFIYQSSGHKTNFVSGEYFNKINMRVEEYSIQVPDDTEAKIGHMCATREGMPYPITQILGAGFVKLLEFLRVKSKNPLASKFNNCIEEQYKIIQDGIGLKTWLDMEIATPKQFRDWVVSTGKFEKIL